MAHKKNKDTAEVVTTPVATEERPAPEPEYIIRECIYGLLINDKVVSPKGQPSEIEGRWHVLFVDTRQEDTSYGPYPMFDELGQPLVGFVPVDMLKQVARKMFSGDLGNYDKAPFPLLSSGCKIMSCMIHD